MPSVEVNLGMADPGGWSLTKCGIGFMPLYDPLGTPKKISEFLQGQRIAGILPIDLRDSMGE